MSCRSGCFFSFLLFSSFFFGDLCFFYGETFFMERLFFWGVGGRGGKAGKRLIIKTVHTYGGHMCRLCVVWCGVWCGCVVWLVWLCGVVVWCVVCVSWCVLWCGVESCDFFKSLLQRGSIGCGTLPSWRVFFLFLSFFSFSFGRNFYYLTTGGHHRMKERKDRWMDGGWWKWDMYVRIGGYVCMFVSG